MPEFVELSGKWVVWSDWLGTSGATSRDDGAHVEASLQCGAQLSRLVQLWQNSRLIGYSLHTDT